MSNTKPQENKWFTFQCNNKDSQ